MSRRALCITGDPALRRTLRRTAQAAGSIVEFADATELSSRTGAPPDLLLLDKHSRQTVDLEQVQARLGGSTKIVVFGDSLEEDAMVSLLRRDSFDHLITFSNEPDDDELVVTTGKLFKNDIFGLEKYLAWGVLVRDREVADYEDKRGAILEVAEYAREAGARRQVVSRIESVADELLMNALYDAPAVRYGVRPRIGERSRAGLGPLGSERALLRYACDGRHFALSVRDNYGELRKEAILDHLQRARTERGNPKSPDDDSGGAGLGLYFILASVTSFIANIRPGEMTEVVCLFDLKATGREQEACARSLHIFTAKSA
jgi:hypothetical protein